MKKLLLVLVIFIVVIACINKPTINSYEFKAYIVSPGDTLWSIAKDIDFKVYNSEDINFVIWQIRKDNGNITPEIRPGQVILVREVK